MLIDSNSDNRVISKQRARWLPLGILVAFALLIAFFRLHWHSFPFAMLHPHIPYNMTADGIARYTLWAAVVSSVATIISCFVNITLAFLTATYVKLTRDMLLETKAAHEPSVYFDLELPDHKINIIVGNSGESPAKNCRFEVIRNTSDIQVVMGEDLSAISLFRHGITFLAPRRVYKYDVGYIYEVGQKPDQVLHVRFTFENLEGETFSQDALIDMAQFSGVLFDSFRDPSHAVAQAIQSAEQNRQIENSFNSSQVQPNQENVPCPVCMEMVLPKARKCKHCMEPIKHVELAINDNLTKDISIS